MSITRRQAATWFETMHPPGPAAREMYQIAAKALRPASREQVNKVRGEWIIEDAGDGDRRKKCSLCNQPISGWWGRDRFCANCGSPMTDEAVEIVMERMEALKDGY